MAAAGAGAGSGPGTGSGAGAGTSPKLGWVASARTAAQAHERPGQHDTAKTRLCALPK